MGSAAYLKVSIQTNTKSDKWVILLDKEKKAKAAMELSDLPEGLKELADGPAETRQEVILLPAAAMPQALPAAGQQPAPAAAQPQVLQQPSRPKTGKELELDTLIAKRQEIIEKLKSKNPLVVEARKKIGGLFPSIRGSGPSHTMKLAAEAEHMEFSIATEAYTPKKEKELIKHLRGIRRELSQHKEIDDARKAVDAQRHALHSVLADVRGLEHELAEVRNTCDAIYAEVLAERKSAYEQRQKNREDRRQKQFVEIQHHVKQERKKQYDDDITPYLKNYDDTVSMDEIVQIEKKEKKKEE